MTSFTPFMYRNPAEYDPGMTKKIALRARW